MQDNNNNNSSGQNINNIDWLKKVKIRSFKVEDAEECFRIRTEAFIKLFYDDMGLGGVVAAVNDYLPNKYIKLAKNNPFLVAEKGNKPVGFITGRIKNEKTIEILFLYIKYSFCRQGIGSKLLNHFEKVIKEDYKKINKIIVNLPFPDHNRKFYEKNGFKKTGISSCFYSGIELDAVQLSKIIN
jgi:ribosomal protein S18 acetylase RimI-like enzyme